MQDQWAAVSQPVEVAGLKVNRRPRLRRSGIGRSHRTNRKCATSRSSCKRDQDYPVPSICLKLNWHSNRSICPRHTDCERSLITHVSLVRPNDSGEVSCGLRATCARGTSQIESGGKQCAPCMRCVRSMMYSYGSGSGEHESVRWPRRARRLHSPSPFDMNPAAGNVLDAGFLLPVPDHPCALTPDHERPDKLRSWHSSLRASAGGIRQRTGDRCGIRHDGADRNHTSDCRLGAEGEAGA